MERIACWLLLWQFLGKLPKNINSLWHYDKISERHTVRYIQTYKHKIICLGAFYYQNHCFPCKRSIITTDFFFVIFILCYFKWVLLPISSIYTQRDNKLLSQLLFLFISSSHETIIDAEMEITLSL